MALCIKHCIKAKQGVSIKLMRPPIYHIYTAIYLVHVVLEPAVHQPTAVGGHARKACQDFLEVVFHAADVGGVGGLAGAAAAIGAAEYLGRAHGHPAQLDGTFGHVVGDGQQLGVPAVEHCWTSSNTSVTTTTSYFPKPISCLARTLGSHCWCRYSNK